MMGNDLATFPDYPAEIRAPAGSLAGVSGFQVHFADHDIFTPGDQPNVLVAMNPAALKANVRDLPQGGMIIVNTDAFNERNLQKAGYAESPLADETLSGFHVHEVALTSMTVEALKGIDGITSREAERSKNFFALGLMSWLFHRQVDGTLAFIEEKFGKKPAIAEANTRAFKAGYNYGETSEDFAVSYEIAPARLEPGRYRQVNGNTALSYGLIAASKLSGLPALPRRLPDHARLVDSRGARAVQELRRHDLPGGRRDRRLRCRPRRLVRRRARRHDLVRPGDRAEGRDGRSRHHARAAAPHRRRPAGRPVDRHADQAGAGGPADGALRSQRREPRSGRRCREPVAVLRRGDRGRADRAQVPDPGLSPVQRGARERLGALAHPRCRLAAVDRDRVRDRAERRRAVPAVPPRPGDARASLGGSRHAGPRAPDRRAREAGRDRRDLVRPRQSRADGAAASPEGRRTSPPTSRSSSSTMSTATPARSSSAGDRRTAPSARPCAACDTPATRLRAPTSTT